MTTTLPESYRWSRLGPESVAAWSELTNLLARVERTEEFYSAEDLAEELDEPGFDARRDSWAVWAGPLLVAFGQLRIAPELADGRWGQCYLDGGVHPDHRGRGIGTALMDAMEARARDLVAERRPGTPLRMRVAGRLEGDPVRPLLDRRGYRIARFFTEMQRPLPGDPLPPADPGVEPYDPGLSEPVRLAHNDAFATHWGSTAQSPESWADRVGSRSFRPGSSTVWRDVGGDVLAYVLTYQWVDGELYVGQVGTRQTARGRGLARACLIGALRAAALSGEYRSVDLSVDSANPTGAGALYSSVGFTPVRTVASYVRDDPPASRADPPASRADPPADRADPRPGGAVRGSAGDCTPDAPDRHRLVPAAGRADAALHAGGAAQHRRHRRRRSRAVRAHAVRHRP